MKAKRLFRSTVSLLLVFCTLLSITGPAFAAPPMEPQLLPGERLEQEPEEAMLYFGVTSANLAEADSLYEIQIFRTGDLSKTVTFELQTLDISALYGRDYVFHGNGLQVYGNAQTQLQRNAFNDLRSEEVRVQEDGSFVPASQVSSLAALKEEQTGEPTRNLNMTDQMIDLAAQVQQAFLPDLGESLDYSASVPLCFEAGEDELRVQFELLDDGESEGDEMFTCVIANVQGIESAQSNTFSAMVLDDEPIVHSRISFSADYYTAENGYVTLTVYRQDAEYSLADVRIRSVDGTAVGGWDYTPVDETLVFTPYETEKTLLVEMPGSGVFELELLEFTGCEAGEITSAVLTSADSSPVMMSAEPVMAVSEVQTAADNPLSFKITINGKTYLVEYDNVYAPIGKIYDESYEPKLWVGNYIFPVDSGRKGWFLYNRFSGEEPWGCGYRASEYCVESESAANQNYGRLRYYHTSIWQNGTAEMLMEKQKLSSIYYQYFAPNWASIDDMFGGQRAQFIMRRDDSNTITKDATGQFDRTLDKSVIVVGETSGGTMTYPSDRWVRLEVKAIDSDKGKTPKSYVNVYGFAAMFKQYNVRMESANPMSYQTPTGLSQPLEAAQVTVKCGAQLISDDYSRSIFVNDDANSSNLVFSVGNTHVNGHDGKYAKIVGYTITLGSGTDKVTLQYPEGLIDFINAAEFQAASCLDYSAEAKKAQIARIQENLDTIPMDGYFISWIERNQPNVTSNGGHGYYQDMVFKPKLEYYDVSVQVKENELARFIDDLLSIGTHSFHAGDYLSMQGEVLDDEHYLAGFEYSTNGGIDYYFVPASDQALFLEPFTDYIVRPVAAEINNYIEVDMTDAAREHLEVFNTIPAEELAENNQLADKILLMCNTGGKDLYEKMLPTVGTSYLFAVKLKEGHTPADPNKEYIVTFYDPVTEKTYTGNVFSHLAKTRITDNRIVVDVLEVDKTEMVDLSIEGTLVCKSRPVRATGLGEGNVALSDRQVFLGSGVLTEDPVLLNSHSGGDGFVSFSGVHVMPGMTVRMMISDGLSEAQVYDYTVPADAQTGETVYTVEPIKVSYSSKYPKIYDVVYSYGKADNNQNSDNTQNSVNVFDDNLDVTAFVDAKDNTIARIEFVVQTVTGEATTYAAATSSSNEGEYTATILKMVDNLYNGDRLYVRVIGEYTAPDGTKMEITYPLVDTGIVFYVENVVKVPQSYDLEQTNTVDIPILGKASANTKTGLISFNKTRWENGNGYTLDLNISSGTLTNGAMSTTDKLTKHKQFFNGWNKAVNSDNKYYRAMNLHQSCMEEYTNVLTDPELDDSAAADFLELARETKAMAAELGNTNVKNMQTAMNKQFILSGSVNIMAQMNFVYNEEENSYVLAYTALSIGGMVNYTQSFYWVVGHVPMFFNINVMVTPDYLGGYNYDNEETLAMITDSEFQRYPGNLHELIGGNGKDVLEITGRFTGQVGVGMCGVLSARGGLTILAQFKQDFHADGLEGALYGYTIQIGVDLLIGSININLLSHMIGSGVYKGQSKVALFGGLFDETSTSSTYAANALMAGPSTGAQEKLLEQQADGTVITYQQSDVGTADMSAFGGRGGMVRATLEPVTKNILLENAAERTRPQLLQLDDGRMFLAFIGARSAEDPTQVLYYAYYNGTSWGTPQIVCDDGTFDSTPALLKVGNQVVLSWADAKRSFTEEDTLKTKLQTLEIVYAVLDTETNTMGDEVVLTDDSYFNFAPHLSLAGSTVHCSYMKRDIAGVTKEDDLLNFESLYSTVADVSYDLEDGRAEEEQYITLRHPAMTDPLTLDFNRQTIIIDRRTYMVSAYTVDEDGKLATQEGKTLWLEIRDLSEKKSYYPIRISSKDASVASPKLYALKDSLYLTYVEDGSLFSLLDVGRLMRDMFDTDEAAGGAYLNASANDTDWYMKSAAELNLSEEEYANSVYDRMCRGDFGVESVNFNADEENTSSPAEYVLTTNGDDLYVFYTALSQKNPGSFGNELYGARYAIADESDADSGFSKASQITDYGCNIDEISLVMDEYNCVHLVANYYKTFINSEGYIETSANSLTELKFVPSDSLTVEEDQVEFEGAMVVGETTMVKFDVLNEGVLPTTGYDVSVTLEKDGVETEVYANTVQNTKIDTAEVAEESFVLPVTEDLEDSILNFYVCEHGTNTAMQYVACVPVPYYSNVKISNMDFEEESGETYLLLEYENTGNKASEAMAGSVQINDNSNELLRTVETFEIPALTSGESFTYRTKFDPVASDYSRLGMVYTRANAVANSEEICSMYCNYVASAPAHAQINGGADVVELQWGEQSQLNVLVAPYASLAGEAVFSSSNPDVATVDDEGNVTAMGDGEAVITVIYPQVGLSDIIKITVDSAPNEPDCEPDDEPSGEYPGPYWPVPNPGALNSITVKDAENGDVFISPIAASSGATVTILVTPDKGYVLDNLTVTDISGRNVELTKVSSTRYTFKMPTSQVTVKVIFKEEAVWQNPFEDVFATDYYYDAVLWAVKEGITNGTSAATFSPNAPCTRAQMVTFLWRAAGSPEPATMVYPFTDVDTDSYYGKAVLWAVENGITNGTSDTTFSPDTECSRAQMATFLCRMAGGMAKNDINTFTDVKAHAYYAEAVQWAVENGITNGTGDNKFSPDATCTRGQMVTFLYRYFEK